MRTLLQSVACGIAAVVVAFFAWMFIAIVAAFHAAESVPHQAGTEVGIDLLTLVHNSPVSARSLALIAFVIGFVLGYRHFSRSARRAQSGPA